MKANIKDLAKLDKIRKSMDELIRSVKVDGASGWEELADADVQLAYAERKMKGLN